jgi:hypothetical protein
LRQRSPELAPVLNQPLRPQDLGVTTENPASEVIAITKSRDETRWGFAANLKNEPARATFQFTLRGEMLDREAEVLDENRKVPVRSGSITDNFAPYTVHLYRLSE